MPRYWVIAPVESKNPQLFNRVWQFDLANGLISIGWSQLGDISKMSRDALTDAVATTYPDKPRPTIGLIVNMLWAFFHEIREGDVVIARRGRKALEAVGEVLCKGVYSPGKNPHLASPEYSHHNFLEVKWRDQPREKAFPNLVFPMHTLSEIEEPEYRNLVEGSGGSLPGAEPPESVEDQTEFVLEKYLEDFIVSNFAAIFKGRLTIYEDQDVGDGQQYPTDIGSIDILAVEQRSGSFVVIELKKGRSSDQVVGQILRYMGWVKRNLCKSGQSVKGVVICRQTDQKMLYALEMIENVDVLYYSVSFKLTEAP